MLCSGNKWVESKIVRLLLKTDLFYMKCFMKVHRAALAYSVVECIHDNNQAYTLNEVWLQNLKLPKLIQLLRLTKREYLRGRISPRRNFALK